MRTKLPTGASIDQDAIKALADLVGRTGAASLEIGARSDDPGARWYARAEYDGRAAIVGTGALEAEADDPAGAADALSRRILQGGRCQGCQQVVVLGSDVAGYCRWTRIADRWTAGCKRVTIRRPERGGAYGGKGAGNGPSG